MAYYQNDINDASNRVNDASKCASNSVNDAWCDSWQLTIACWLSEVSNNFFAIKKYVQS